MVNDVSLLLCRLSANNSMDTKYQVFVSSTYEDLQEERKKVMEALLQMNCFPVGMEYFNASDESQWDVIKSLIDECDYYVLIVAGRYGSIDESTGKSYTQKEYEYAESIGVPTIAFLFNDISSLPKGKTESDPSIEKKLDLFKDNVKKRLCKFWDTGDNLASQVVLSLTKLIKTRPRTGWVKADQISFPEANAEIVKLRKRIDELNEKIHKYEDSEPEGVENLAQGEDTIVLSFYSNSFQKKTESEVFTWNDIFSLLAPHMIVECSEVNLKNALDEFFIIHKMGGSGRWLIFEDSSQSIKIQLLALGLIRESARIHSSADNNVYWSLTPWGKNLLMRLSAIKKGYPDQKPE